MGVLGFESGGESMRKITFRESQVSKNRFLADLDIGLCLAFSESDWNFSGEPKRGILSSVSFNFGFQLVMKAALIIGCRVWIHYSGFTILNFLLYIGLIVLIIGTIITVCASLENNLESQTVYFLKMLLRFQTLFRISQNFTLNGAQGLCVFHDC